jgi:hypothetical protein
MAERAAAQAGTAPVEAASAQSSEATQPGAKA